MVAKPIPPTQSEHLLDQEIKLESLLEPQVIEPPEKVMQIKAPETTTPEPELTETQTVPCPICQNQIQIHVTPCPHCGSELNW